ncbi:MAG: alpha-glucosidase C-terminal domain-containing protein, partial [Nitrospiraceae bacterium]|nr:alpha-glucosidase C-terminal domain-containing protein [Nitrospiraceae bacterium]
PTSPLNMLRQMIAVRQSVRIFGRGTMELLAPKNRKIMSYLRTFEGKVVLVINNLSDSTESLSIDLSRYSGWTPVEMFSQTPFPEISRLPYHFSVSPYGFFWLLLSPPERREKKRNGTDRLSAPLAQTKG